MTADLLEERPRFQRALDLVTFDPPQIHPSSRTGIQSASGGCLRFIGRLLEKRREGVVTLETGLGVSTVVFVASGARHTSVYASSPARPQEGERLVAWFNEHGIDATQLRLVAAPPQRALPVVCAGEEYDVVLINGCHGYPLPQIEWFYACAGLRAAGVVVVHGLQHRAPKDLVGFLASDPRWKPLARQLHWAAFRRHGQWDLAEGWGSQTFFSVPGRRIARTMVKELVPGPLKVWLRSITGGGA